MYWYFAKHVLHIEEDCFIFTHCPVWLFYTWKMALIVYTIVYINVAMGNSLLFSENHNQSKKKEGQSAMTEKIL